MRIAADQMKTQIHILNDLRKAKGLGIEGWFKIELYHALKQSVIPVKIKNKGPDLIFEDFKLEVKSAQSKSASWVRKKGLKYPGVDCLFLGLKTLVESLGVDYHIAIDDYWIVGLLTANAEENKVK